MTGHLRERVVDRDLVAFILSVPTAVVVWICTALVWLVVIDGPAAASRDIPTLLLSGAFGGIWVSLGAVIFLAGPLYIGCELAGRVSHRIVLVGGAAVGVATSLGLRSFLGEGELLTPAMGGVIGLITGTVWWRVSGRSVVERGALD